MTRYYGVNPLGSEESWAVEVAIDKIVIHLGDDCTPSGLIDARNAAEDAWCKIWREKRDNDEESR